MPSDNQTVIETLAALHPDRLPPMTAAGVVAEGLAALALGLALAQVAVWGLRALVGRPPSRRARARADLAAARRLDGPARLAVQVGLLRSVAADLGLGPDWAPALERRLGVALGDLGPALYARPGTPVPDLEPAVRRALAWMRD